MAFYPELRGAALQAYNGMLSQLKSRALKQLKISEDQLILRSLRPQDIGLSNPEWTFQVTSSDAWNTIIDSQTINDNRFVGINGARYVISGDQAVTQLKIKREGQVKRYWNIQGINYNENQEVYVDDPVLVDQNTPLTIDAYGVSTGTENIVFHGAVAESKGILVS